ncbi:hypothetical protein GCM10010503_41340 [Streptomyces lucensis JCM 4490]|uniref:AMP-dependent synthetase/ligase domain-containing protein n=1 Tax=Streptomyces lucensis JCM 4490 TaxID=1306176 RepID=A0A918J8A2_9ACTN|nr:AMP-binding protein [Streptomyces lucensis]GGW59844.1 hypothetical protein GCM10010503_41340 [Streptomyces lucensis JCM 4490]
MSVEHVPLGGQHVDELVTRWAETTPSAEAIVCGVERITYGELDRLVDMEADRLRSVGLEDGALAAVVLDNPVAALTAMLGVLRAGGAYLPLDPATPRETLHRILTDADPYVVLTRELYRVAASDRPHRRVVCVDAEAEPVDTGGTQPHAHHTVDAPPARGATACVLLTAGTTGSPGLVPVSHHDLVVARNAWQQVYGFDARDRHVHSAPPESAEFTAGWVRALGAGGTLLLPHGDAHHEPGARGTALRRLIADEEATVLACGVPTARLLTAQGALHRTRLRLVTVTGDVWYLDEQRALKDAFGGGVRVVNAYTVTEAFGAGAYFELPEGMPPPEHEGEPVSLIGVPLPETYLAVRGPGPGTRGPIVLNGVHTGDDGRVRDDGLLEFLGRQGTYASAERALHGHPDVRAGLVTEVETTHPRDVKVVAYAVPVEGRDLDPVDVHRHMCRTLPGDARPHAVVPVPSLPRTRADKVDRENLPLPVGTSASPGHKGGAMGPASRTPKAPAGCMVVGVAFLAAFFALLAWVFTDLLWPHSTDVSNVPSPYATRFRVLYFCEDVSFGAGMAFLLVGRPGMARAGHTRWFTTAAHLSAVWLMAAWWPQDNLYRLTAKTDWPAQSVLVYTFNVSLMAAAAVVAAFAAVTPKWQRRLDR